jgi:uncharacterized protein (DUF4213/DUF364 family)
MNIRNKIKDLSFERAGDIIAEEVRIGLAYTAVKLSDGNIGIAFTFGSDHHKGCGAFTRMRPLSGRRASQLLSLFDSGGLMESAVALATANALSNKPAAAFKRGDVLDHIDINHDDTVGVVGNFVPLMPELKRRTSRIKVFDQRDCPMKDVMPEEEVYKQLPYCQIALVSSTTIINSTIEKVLDSAKGARAVIMLGASTPMMPEAFSGSPVTDLSGVIITRPKELLGIVSEGGGMRAFRECVKKVNAEVVT